MSKLAEKSAKAIAVQHNSTSSGTEVQPDAAAMVRELPRIPERVAALSTEIRQRLESFAGAARARSIAVPEAAAPARASITRIREVVGNAGLDTSASIQPTLAPDLPPVVRAVAGAIFNTLSGLIRAVDGGPVVPPALRDSVQVSTSTLVIAPGHEVEARSKPIGTGRSLRRVVHRRTG